MQTYTVNSREVPFIKRWLEQRDLPTRLDSLPDHGVLVCSEDRPVAVGFIRKCEGNFAIIDSVVTNPQVHGTIRHEAMDVLTTALLQLSKDLNLHRIIAFSTDENTLIRSKKFGFGRTPHTVISLDLNE